MIKKYYVSIEWNEDTFEETKKEYAEEFDGAELPCEFEIDVDTDEVNENNIHKMIDYLANEVEIEVGGWSNFRLDSFYEIK